MARRSIPYPPSPTWIPGDLTSVGRESMRDVAAVMIGLFVFLGLYAILVLAALAGVAAGLYLCVARGGVCVGIPIVLVCGCIAFMLIRVLFYRGRIEKDLRIELMEEEQPVLFAFLRELADEVGAPEPDRVFVMPEVNASALSEVSLVNLFVPPRRTLTIGLAYVNVLNLSEFKAVIGHEFGHFAQETGRMGSYIQIAFRVMAALYGGETWAAKEARAIGRGNRYDHGPLVRLSILIFVGGPVWVVSKVAWLIFYFIEVSRLSLSRNQEFHADRMAVSVAGSNAAVHSLFRGRFADESWDETFRVLDIATQHNLYTRDLYYHHTRSADRLRKVRRNSALGVPPVLKRPEDGRDIRVFDKVEEDVESDKWSTHPSDSDREKNAKRVFVPAEEDTRPAWILFADADELRERMAYKVYRRVFRIKKSIELDPPERVQQIIDEEHAEVTFDPKYHGAYDDRWIAPGDIAELNGLIEREPWDPGRVGRAHGRLYRELGRRADDWRELRSRIREIYRKSCGRPRGRKLDKVRDLEQDLDDLADWFSGFDRRVYLIFGHMASQAGGRWPQELTDRYLFHLDVQALHIELARVMDRVDDVVAACSHFEDGLLPEDYFYWAMDTLRAARQTLLDCIDRARGLRTPELANIKAGTRLHTLIFDQEVLHDLPRSHIKPAWIIKLGRQMGRMRNRLCRMDFKSLGALLQLQDRLAQDWRAKLPPTNDTAPLPEADVVEAARPANSTAKPD